MARSVSEASDEPQVARPVTGEAVLPAASDAARLKVLIAGISSLVLMLGIARFAYTPLMPLMQAQTWLGLEEGAWLASLNYLGYFSGVLLASLLNDLRTKDTLYRIGLLLAVSTTAGSALSDNFWWLGGLRYLAGLSSAAGLMLGSGLVLNWLMRHHYRSELGVHFAGVGIGIALCSLLIEVLTPTLDWREHWLLLGGLGLLLAVPAWLWLPRPVKSHLPTPGRVLSDSPPTRNYLLLFCCAYALAGVGYVVSATFIVAIIDAESAGNAGTRAFLVLGLAAAPACLILDRVARVLGDHRTLLLTCVLHTFSILTPYFSNALWLAYLSAALFGATFIGIVSLVLTMAGKHYPTKPAKMMGKLTIGYAVAQIVAPAIVGQITLHGGSYRDGLLLAGLCMALATGLVEWLRRLARDQKMYQ